MAGFLSGIFSKVIVLATPEASWSINNPIGFLPESVNPVLNYVYGIPMITVLVVGVFALIIRFRRSDEAVRAQIKWVSLSLIVFVVTLLFRFATYPGEDLLSQVLFSAATAFIPVSMTLGILRYRLFDIDRLISRTVGYVVVVAALGSVYVLGAVWLPSRLLGEQPTLFVAGSTLAVAALFNPVRNRVLAWVDRRFYRSQYDAQRVVDDFTGRLRNRLDVEQLISESMSVVAEVMHPSAIAVWVVDQTVE
jgi:FtsH-binding integral membrane protein